MMLLRFRKILFTFAFNFSLFLILMISIQNSSQKNKVNLLIAETVSLPTSFIIGVSFICGSLTSSFLTIDYEERN
tara:strand:+ start:17 stop:241 length:225 start_codon:yes stop_codon:yes gene_type:complete